MTKNEEQTTNNEMVEKNENAENANNEVKAVKAVKAPKAAKAVNEDEPVVQRSQNRN